MNRRSKIIATIGPASQDEQTLQQLIRAGMDVARLNFSHGSHEHYNRLIPRLREVSRQSGRPLTILQDLQGPKIRVGELTGGQAQLLAGREITITTDIIAGDEKTFCVDFPGLPGLIMPGSRILIDDGKIELAVLESGKKSLRARVVTGGLLLPNKGLNLPGVRLDVPNLTPKDEADLAFGLEHGVDVLAISFVRTANDVTTVRQAIARLKPERASTPIIAKIERPEALENLDEIIRAADGVMVARGDLGVEMSPESVPIAQKKIIAAANCYTKVVVTATQMLDSMVENLRPTRAEASDVANAIFDGSDAVLLSGETASGKHPVEAVRTMATIIAEAEANMAEWGHWSGPPRPDSGSDDAYFVTRAARELAVDKNVAAIAIFTRSGRTALLMSKARPVVDVLAFTSNPDVYNRLNLLWGVQPHLTPHVETIEAMLKAVEETLLASTPTQAGQQVVLACGFPVQSAASTNLALIHTIGS